MNIYQLVFGRDSGQVNCVFHNDNKASAGISANYEYHCFTCNKSAHDEVGFIAKYFGVGMKRAEQIKESLAKTDTYVYTQNPLDDEQVKYLQSIGLTDEVIQKNFFKAGTGKLVFSHKWNGVQVGATWFNNPTLSNYSASAEKYKYLGRVLGGMLTPMDTVLSYNTIIVCEGEKDMLTAQSMGIKNAVAKLGGAKTYIMAGIPLQNKKVVLIYDCDDAGREGALQDAQNLVERFACEVKIIDLGLENKGDLNDYFMKHNKTVNDLYQLIKDTPKFVVTESMKKSKLTSIIDRLSDDERIELRRLLNEGKGETHE
jgi:DNA primase